MMGSHLLYNGVTYSRHQMIGPFAHDVKPEHVGHYACDNNYELSNRSSKYLRGHPMRWWDGQQWLAWEGGPKSVMGSHIAHRWYGLKEKS